MDGMQTSGWLRRDGDGVAAPTVGQVVREYRLAGGANQAAVADGWGSPSSS